MEESLNHSFKCIFFKLSQVDHFLLWGFFKRPPRLRIASGRCCRLSSNLTARSVILTSLLLLRPSTERIRWDFFFENWHTVKKVLNFEIVWPTPAKPRAVYVVNHSRYGQIIASVCNLLLTYSSTQWPAVATHNSLIKAPPHRCVEEKPKNEVLLTET